MPYLSILGYQMWESEENHEIRKGIKEEADERGIRYLVRIDRATVENLGDAILEYHQVRGFHT